VFPRLEGPCSENGENWPRPVFAGDLTRREGILWVHERKQPAVTHLQALPCALTPLTLPTSMEHAKDANAMGEMLTTSCSIWWIAFAESRTWSARPYGAHHSNPSRQTLGAAPLRS
jgi:hypothetical protein